MAIDFIIGLPAARYSRGVIDAVFIAVDRYTKMARYVPYSKIITIKELAELFIEEIWYRGFTLDSIVSDRRSLFTSKFWSKVCYYLKMKRRLSTAFHP